MVTAASFSSEISGIQRHALNLVRCLLQRCEISRVDLVVAPWQTRLVATLGMEGDVRLKMQVADMQRGSVSRNFWYYRRLPSLAARLRPDLVHLSYPMPIDTGSLHCPTVLTLHDLYPFEIPENFRFPHVMVNRFVLKQCLRDVDAIACVSDATMASLRRYGPALAHEKAVRIYNCVEPHNQRIVRSPIPGWQGEPFLLCIAQHRRNKNVVLLLRAFHRLFRASLISPTMKLVVVGIDGPETQRIRQVIAELQLGYQVFLLHGLSEPELQWCYARCEGLVVPSKVEGFGLPVAEALMAGCRVLCSDIDSLREIGGAHCHYVALGVKEEEALAEAIQKLLQQPKKCPVSLPHLGAEALGLQYRNLYQRLVRGATVRSARGKLTVQTAFETPSSSGGAEQGGAHGRI